MPEVFADKLTGDQTGDQETCRQNGDRALEQVKDKADFALNRPHRAGHIGCSDIAGTDFADIDPVQYSL